MLVSIIFMTETNLYLLFSTLGSQANGCHYVAVWKVTKVFVEFIESAFFTENKTFPGVRFFLDSRFEITCLTKFLRLFQIKMFCFFLKILHKIRK